MTESQDKKFHLSEVLPKIFRLCKKVTLAENPFFVLGRRCGTPTAITAMGFKKLPAELTLLVTAYPPNPGMLCPIVVECDSGPSPWKGLQPEMDFPEISFMHWSEVEVVSSLPKIFA